MYIICTKDEFRSLISNCTKSAKMKHGLVSCKGCALQGICKPSVRGVQPGDILTQISLIVRPGEDAFFTNTDTPEEEIE